MRIGHAPDTNRTRVVVLSADTEFENSVRATFGASSAIELRMVSGSLAEQGDSLDVTDATVAVVDLDARQADEMEALARLMARVGTWPPIITITQTFDANVARTSASFVPAPGLRKAPRRESSRPRQRPTRFCRRLAGPALRRLPFKPP